MNVCHCSSWYFNTDNHLNVSAGLVCFKAVWRVFVNGLAFWAIWTRQTWILQLSTICLLQTRPYGTQFGISLFCFHPAHIKAVDSLKLFCGPLVGNHWPGNIVTLHNFSYRKNSWQISITCYAVWTKTTKNSLTFPCIDTK